MKVTELLEDKNDHPFVGLMLLKLYKQKQPMKVLLTGLWKPIKKPGESVAQRSDIPDQEWDVKSVRINKTPNGDYIRVSNTSPEQWFELNPDDDEHLRIIDKRDDGGYWLLTSRDGKGVKL